MKVKLTSSRGIRIPKSVAAQCGFGNMVELRVVTDGLLITPSRAPRTGWRQSFAASKPERRLSLDCISESDFDRKEWQW